MFLFSTTDQTSSLLSGRSPAGLGERYGRFAEESHRAFQKDRFSYDCGLQDPLVQPAEDPSKQQILQETLCVSALLHPSLPRFLPLCLISLRSPLFQSLLTSLQSLAHFTPGRQTANSPGCSWLCSRCALYCWLLQQDACSKVVKDSLSIVFRTSKQAAAAKKRWGNAVGGSPHLFVLYEICCECCQLVDCVHEVPRSMNIL